MDRSTPDGELEHGTDGGREKPKRDRAAEGIRSTRVDGEPRRVDVEMLLLSQMHHAKIARLMATKHGVNERTIWRDIAIVLGRMRKVQSAKTPLERKNELMAACGDLYGRCLAAKDFRAATMVLDKILKMEGAYAPTDVRVDVRVEHRLRVGEIAADQLDDAERVLAGLLESGGVDAEVVTLDEIACATKTS